MIKQAVGAAVSVELEVNGQGHEATVAPGTLLADFLRDDLGLTGTKVGCETGQCGACVVLLDGVSVKSCSVLAAQADGSSVTTVEGLAGDGGMNALQQALWENHAVQCGYCTPGILLGLTDLLSRDAHVDEAKIRAWLDGNMCRCSVYQNVIRAVQSLSGYA
jgi:aerobic carbon-monoxide dehydrogenase small subunit